MEFPTRKALKKDKRASNFPGKRPQGPDEHQSVFDYPRNRNRKPQDSFQFPEKKKKDYESFLKHRLHSSKPSASTFEERGV